MRFQVPNLIGPEQSVIKSLPPFSAQNHSLSNQSIQRESPEHQNHHESETHTVKKGRPPVVKNKPDSWKYTSAPASWKPLATLKLEINPDSVAYRTRL